MIDSRWALGRSLSRREKQPKLPLGHNTCGKGRVMAFFFTSVGDATDNTINGTPSNDSLAGNGGDDLVFGDSGDDHIDGNDGQDTLFGDAGNDVVHGGNLNDLEFGGAG